MRRLLLESWAFVAVAVIALAAGVLIGSLGSSPEKQTVYVAAAAGEAEGAEATEPSGEAEAGEPAPGEAAGSAGAQLFTGLGCASCHTLAQAGATGTTGPDLNESLAPDDDTRGIEEMIVHPNSEVVEGYSPNVMPQSYGQSLSRAELHELAEFLVASTAARPR